MADLKTAKLFIGMFYFFPPGECRFRNKKYKMVEFFHKNKDEYPDLLKHMQFYKTSFGYNPSQVSQALSTLGTMGVLSSWGIMFDPYEFTCPGPNYIRNHVFSTFDQDRLKELSDLFQEEFMHPMSAGML
jgi:hypothetical protein